MTNLQKAQDYAAKRLRAERNVRAHIDSILSDAAIRIAREAQGIVLISSKELFAQIMEVRSRAIIEEAEREINEYIRAYSKAAIVALGDKDTGATGRLLNSELFGKTFTERSMTYMGYFLDDVAKMLIAAKRLKMSQDDIEKTIKQQFKDPYTNGIIDKANRKGANIEIPFYGHGLYRSAYGNIVRNAQGTISIAWGREERNFANRNGAIGFRVHRGSSYPCPICEDEVDRGIHKMSEPTVPFHARCCCWIEYIYAEE